MRKMYLPPITNFGKGFIAVAIGLFLLNSILSKFAGVDLSPYLGLSAPQLFKGHIYQFFTHPLLCSSFFEVLFDCMVIWFFGSELEKTWGRTRFISFLLTATVVSSIVYLAVILVFFSGSPLSFYPLRGLGGLVGAMCVAYGVLWPERTLYFFMFPVKAKWFVVLVVAMALYQGIFSPGGVQAWGQLGAFAGGYLWMITISSDRFKNMKDKRKLNAHRKKSGHLSIVKDDDDSKNGPTYH